VSPLPFAWPYAPLFWGVVVWAFSPEVRIVRQARQAARHADSQDAGSVRLLVYGGGIATVAAFFLSWVPAFRLPASWQLAVFVIGIATLIAGSLLRRHCWRQLGSSFTGDVRAEAGQRIVTTGAYAKLRHPAYSAGILMNAGIGIALGSWASISLLVLASFAIYAYRIAVEERVLLATVGPPYREFMRTRWRLIPYVY
jgi:protein-S-isoprenylcysteine O-methyltransferase Ste14